MWFQYCHFQIAGLFSLRKFHLTYFSHNYHNYSMFRDVPDYSIFLVLSTPYFCPNYAYVISVDISPQRHEYSGDTEFTLSKIKRSFSNIKVESLQLQNGRWKLQVLGSYAHYTRQAMATFKVLAVLKVEISDPSAKCVSTDSTSFGKHVFASLAIKTGTRRIIRQDEVSALEILE